MGWPRLGDIHRQFANLSLPNISVIQYFQSTFSLFLNILIHFSIVKLFLQIHTEESSAKEFVESPDVLDATHKIVKKAECTHIRQNEHKLVVSYLSAIIIYGNGQRPSVVQYMDTTEYLERTTLKDSSDQAQNCFLKAPQRLLSASHLLTSYHDNIRQKMKAASEG